MFYNIVASPMFSIVSSFASSYAFMGGNFGAGLFLFAPPMIWRLHGHLSLVGHFIVLAALYLTLMKGGMR